MDYSILEILTLIGSLGLFLYGMKLMSEALQKVAGNRMRSILSKMTSNRLKGVFTGFLVTTGIQSSSATTVMLVSFVNAGLITLIGSIGVIMGANIGTTVTGWLVSYLGFKISISKIALPIIGLSLPLLFSRKKQRKFWGEFLIGFAILFIGLGSLKSSVPDLKISEEFAKVAPEIFEMESEEVKKTLEIMVNDEEYVDKKLAEVYPDLDPESKEFKEKKKKIDKQLSDGVDKLEQKISVINYISGYKGEGFGSILLFLLIGTVLTIIIQSSSATMTLTIVMAFNGIIPFHLAAAMILGENIGTTITANIAALVGNTSAKRAARAHLIFNVIGVVWVLVIFNLFINGVDVVLVRFFDSNSAFTDANATPFGLSLFHTIFNILNTVVLVWFAPAIAKLVIKLVKEKDEEEEFRLKHMDTVYSSNVELSVYQAKQEIAIYAKRGKKMFGATRCLCKETNDKKFKKLWEKIQKYEDIGDNMEIEIAGFLTKITESELTILSSKRVRSMFTMIDNIESIFDASYNIARAVKRKKNQGIWFTPEVRDRLSEFFDLVDESLTIMVKNLENNYPDVDLGSAKRVEQRINEMRDMIKAENLKSIKDEDYKYQAGVIYNEMYTLGETLADHVINVSEAVDECKE